MTTRGTLSFHFILQPSIGTGTVIGIDILPLDHPSPSIGRTVPFLTFNDTDLSPHMGWIGQLVSMSRDARTTKSIGHRQKLWKCRPRMQLSYLLGQSLLVFKEQPGQFLEEGPFGSVHRLGHLENTSYNRVGVNSFSKPRWLLFKPFGSVRACERACHCVCVCLCVCARTCACVLIGFMP